MVSVLRALRARLFGATTLLLLPIGAASQTLPGPLKTFVTEIGQPPKVVAARLSADLGGALDIVEESGAFLMAYAGNEIPDPLRRFVLTALPQIDPERLAPGAEVNLSLAFMPAGAGTTMRVMVSSPALADPGALTTALGPTLPKGASVLMNDGAAGGCAGQVILSQPAPPAEAAPLYVDLMTRQGFEITDASDASTSFFVGQRQDCALFLYVQPDPAEASQSTVIVKFLEE
ncbi:hypothetical protein [Defluviimonas sp. SAOS-178_SWC]|uniref:hypothetical protein n=1 Tax=Defluviimonas sp. SAOS-178_SWC TaxID=3121287 RepID=UPI0032218877